MPKVTAQFYGGSSYSLPDPDDTEQFDSMADAKIAFENRFHGWERKYPVVNDAAWMRVWKGLHHNVPERSPEWVFTLVRTGQDFRVKVERS